MGCYFCRLGYVVGEVFVDFFVWVVMCVVWFVIFGFCVVCEGVCCG